ncbi:CRABP2 [Lepeophtheirus salmonis]|uniref:CRABP2 n=1 Tax=Lepeophtheirus salmonis TaxID=72036 RepID=A0A7R8CQ94_LEPSM|nr:CRABP2 [Lepeophtheirus salmonis]CAF2893394.1 CRABP2 [Lepeophtheirus salmonis]
MEAFMGKYNRISSEKYEDLLKELGVNVLLRKAALVSTPSFEVSKEGEVWSFKTSTVAKSMELKFEVGKKFEETTSDGRTQMAKKDGQKSTKTVRDFKEGKCTQITEVVGSDVKCTQVFEKA